MTTLVSQARTRVKNHLAARGEDTNFTITPRMCLYWWNILNVAVFHGKLNRPYCFYITKSKHTLGWCKPWNPYADGPRQVVIAIDDDIMNRREFLTVLVHEMVHQWEWEILCCWVGTEHGVNFFSWREKIKRSVGLPLNKDY